MSTSTLSHVHMNTQSSVRTSRARSKTQKFTHAATPSPIVQVWNRATTVTAQKKDISGEFKRAVSQRAQTQSSLMDSRTTITSKSPRTLSSRIRQERSHVYATAPKTATRSGRTVSTSTYIQSPYLIASTGNTSATPSSYSGERAVCVSSSSSPQDGLCLDDGEPDRRRPLKYSQDFSLFKNTAQVLMQLSNSWYKLVAVAVCTLVFIPASAYALQNGELPSLSEITPFTANRETVQYISESSNLSGHRLRMASLTPDVLASLLPNTETSITTIITPAGDHYYTQSTEPLRLALGTKVITTPEEENAIQTRSLQNVDWKTSLRTFIETYELLPITLGFLAVLCIATLLHHKAHKGSTRSPETAALHIANYVLFVVALVVPFVQNVQAYSASSAHVIEKLPYTWSLTGDILSDIGFTLMIGGLFYMLGTLWGQYASMKHKDTRTPTVMRMKRITTSVHTTKPTSNFLLFTIFIGLIGCIALGGYVMYTRIVTYYMYTDISINQLLFLLASIGAIVLGSTIVIALIQALFSSSKPENKSIPVHKQIHKKVRHQVAKKHVKKATIATLLLLLASGSTGFIPESSDAFNLPILGSMDGVLITDSRTLSDSLSQGTALDRGSIRLALATSVDTYNPLSKSSTTAVSSTAEKTPTTVPSLTTNTTIKTTTTKESIKEVSKNQPSITKETIETSPFNTNKPLPQSLEEYLFLKDMNQNLGPTYPEEVKRIQEFLNYYLGTDLEVNGYFGPETTQAVNTYQNNDSDILIQAGVGHATGNFFKFSRGKANKVLNDVRVRTGLQELDIPDTEPRVSTIEQVALGEQSVSACSAPFITELTRDSTDTSEIQRVQLFLVQQGYSIEVTGTFESKTEEAVKDFQLQNYTTIMQPRGLEEPPGIWDSLTRDRANTLCAP